MAARSKCPPRLSIAMIVRNAKEHLAEGLGDLAEFADEIVIADTGSSDRTLDVARRRATRVLEIPWTDDFSAARNAVWDSLTGDWILWLDAGERLAPASARALAHSWIRPPIAMSAIY
ncbi:MAG: glycosyltransferase [Pirellulales bacterium]